MEKSNRQMQAPGTPGDQGTAEVPALRGQGGSSIKSWIPASAGM